MHGFEHPPVVHQIVLYHVILAVERFFSQAKGVWLSLKSRSQAVSSWIEDPKRIQVVRSSWQPRSRISDKEQAPRHKELQILFRLELKQHSQAI